MVPLCPAETQANGYLAIEREWQRETGRVRDGNAHPDGWAHPAVRHLQGRVAIQRGPMVYCLEGVDHGGIGLDRIAVDPEHVRPRNLRRAPGIPPVAASVYAGQGHVADEEGWEGVLYRRPGLPPAGGHYGHSLLCLG